MSQTDVPGCPKLQPARVFISVACSPLGLTAESLFPHLSLSYADVLWDRPIVPSSEETSILPGPVLT